jgi:hypothetical protein
MDEMTWLTNELERSRAGFDWGIRQVPGDRLALPPPAGLGEWAAIRHVHHLAWYERQIALPGMRMWQGAPAIEPPDEDVAWAADDAAFQLESGLQLLAAVRAEEVELLKELGPDAWAATRETGWGNVPLKWVIAKTYQHTAEHTNDALRIALFWDSFAAAIAALPEDQANG